MATPKKKDFMSNEPGQTLSNIRHEIYEILWDIWDIWDFMRYMRYMRYYEIYEIYEILWDICDIMRYYEIYVILWDIWDIREDLVKDDSRFKILNSSFMWCKKLNCPNIGFKVLEVVWEPP